MPTTSGLTTAQTRLANAVFGDAYLPRVLKSVYPKVCRITKSSSMHEPFVFRGAAPLMKYFQGSVDTQSINSFAFDVPNPCFRNMEYIQRNQIEFDQIKTLVSRTRDFGVRVAQLPDYFLANQMIQGDLAGSQNFVNFDDGKTYSLTFDNQPVYSSSHYSSPGGTTYDNILQGNLPATTNLFLAQDLAVSANQLQRDMQNIIQFVASIQDDKGGQLLPDFDPEKQLVLLYPPLLGPAMSLAFDTTGTIGGSSGSSSGATTNIGKRIVKELVPFSLLQGCTNILSQVPNAQLTPVNPTRYYWAIDGDYVGAWYKQTFTPLKNTVPAGYDPEAEANKILSVAHTLGMGITKDMADMYAAAEVATNMNAIGESAQESVYTQEQFFIAGRARTMIFPGPWFCNGICVPQGYST